MPTPRLLRAQAALLTLARAVTKKMAMTQILLLETVALLVAELVRVLPTMLRRLPAVVGALALVHGTDASAAL